MSMSPDDLLEDLVAQSWAVWPAFLDEAACDALRREIRAADAAGALKPAAVGRGSDQAVRDDVRRDRILWVEPDAAGEGTKAALARLEALRIALNRGLFLGLKELEAHFAVYPPAGFYAKHLDRHRDTDARVVSCILYLNDAWTPADGGALQIFDPADPDRLATTVEPRSGTLACFLADRVWHAVAPTHRERLALTGWFRR